MPAEIRRITEAFLHNPQRVEVSKPATAAVTVTLSQVTAGREPHQKREVLRRLLREAKDLKNAIIFCNRKRDVAVLHKSLQKHGFSAGALHGDMDQPARMAALDQFRKGELPLLVASDVAARGLDIPEVSHVFNFDVPHHPDDYVHRIGRTGRAGRTGTAISIVTALDQKSVAAIEKLIGQSIPRTEIDVAANADASDVADQPRKRRPRQESHQESRRGRKPRREREARQAEPRQAEARQAEITQAEPRPAHGNANGHGHHGKSPQAHVSRTTATARGGSRRAARDADSEPGDHSHLPAFLLRPVRARV
jgi:superfamily II DNA/RNA helicase